MERRPFDLPRYLATLPLFGDLTAQEVERLMHGCVLSRLERGASVFCAGQPCEEFHVVVIGQIKLYAISPAGQEKVIDLIGPGRSFAEAMMFLGHPYAVNAQALTPTLLLTVKKAAVLAEIAADSRFALRMLASLSRRLHGLVRDVQSYAFKSGTERVIGYLLADGCGQQDGGVADGPLTVTLPVSKATIASRLSLTPEYFSRVLHELEAAGLIELDKRHIRIPRPQALSEYVAR